MIQTLSPQYYKRYRYIILILVLLFVILLSILLMLRMQSSSRADAHDPNSVYIGDVVLHNGKLFSLREYIDMPPYIRPIRQLGRSGALEMLSRVRVEKRPAIVSFRERAINNIYHVIHFSLLTMMKQALVRGLDSLLRTDGQFVVLFGDNIPKGYFFDLFKATTAGVDPVFFNGGKAPTREDERQLMHALSHGQLDDIVIFERVYYAKYGFSFDVEFCFEFPEQVEANAIVRHVVRKTLRHYELQATLPDADYIHVTVIERSQRRILNMDELVQRISSMDERFKVKVVQMTGSVQSQIAIMRQTHILVGMHGAGLSWLIFLPPQSAIVEILPYEWKSFCYYSLARASGHLYLGWTNTDKSKNFPSSPHEKDPRSHDTLVDIDAVASMVYQAAPFTNFARRYIDKPIPVYKTIEYQHIAMNMTCVSVYSALVYTPFMWFAKQTRKTLSHPPKFGSI